MLDCLLFMRKSRFQWSGPINNNSKRTFPIKYSSLYSIFLTTKATTFRYSPWPQNISNSSFTVRSDVEASYTLSLGK